MAEQQQALIPILIITSTKEWYSFKLKPSEQISDELRERTWEFLSRFVDRLQKDGYLRRTALNNDNKTTFIEKVNNHDPSIKNDGLYRFFTRIQALQLLIHDVEIKPSPFLVLDDYPDEPLLIPVERGADNNGDNHAVDNIDRAVDDDDRDLGDLSTEFICWAVKFESRTHRYEYVIATNYEVTPDGYRWRLGSISDGLYMLDDGVGIVETDIPSARNAKEFVRTFNGLSKRDIGDEYGVLQQFLRAIKTNDCHIEEITVTKKR